MCKAFETPIHSHTIYNQHNTKLSSLNNSQKSVRRLGSTKIQQVSFTRKSVSHSFTHSIYQTNQPTYTGVKRRSRMLKFKNKTRSQIVSLFEKNSLLFTCFSFLQLLNYVLSTILKKVSQKTTRSACPPTRRLFSILRKSSYLNVLMFSFSTNLLLYFFVVQN